MTSNTTEALGHVTSTDVQQPRTIYVQFSEIGTIRKWAWEPFDKAEPLIAENGWVSDTPTLCATGDDGELADLFWRIKEKMPFHHEELLGLADRITALSAEVERKDEALRSAVDFLKSAPLESGYCCCGDAVDAHGMGSGHSPVDELAYAANNLWERIEEALGAKP